MIRKTFPIDLAGQLYQLDFDWIALADIYERYGATHDLFNPATLREIVRLGLSRHHPELDQAFVDRASPPMVSTIAIVDRALRYAYDGIDPDAEEVKPPTRRQRHKAAVAEPTAAAS